MVEELVCCTDIGSITKEGLNFFPEKNASMSATKAGEETCNFLSV